MKSFLTLTMTLILGLHLSAQANFWQEVKESQIFLSQSATPQVEAKQQRTLSLDFDAIRTALKDAPMEFTPEAATDAVQLYFPLPNGETTLMEVVESPVMHPDLAARYPSIRAYAARSLDNPLISARLDYSPEGFNAVITTPEGRAFITPYATQQTRYYTIYYGKNISIDPSILPPRSCGFYDFDAEEEMEIEQQIALSERTDLSFRNNDAVPLRTYRLALACTGEYGQNKGGTVAAVLGTYNTTLNVLNQIIQLETSVRMELVPGVEAIIFTDPNTDPYINANNGASLLGQNTAAISQFFPPNFYDLGHVFTMGCNDVGGIAGGTVCSQNKARGVTCHYNSNVAFIVSNVMAHEVAHQFGVGHSWNNCPGNLDQLSSSNAFEPGSGSTIMSYQGSCGAANNVPFPSGDYYNIGSVEDFIFFSRVGSGAGCGESVLTDNHEPVINWPYGNNFWIPRSTPFELQATAEDIDGDELTYCWEQYDLGPNTNLGSPIGNSPLFRSFPPTVSNKRVFPRINSIVENNFNVTEVLPTYERDLTFRMTVRDNNPNHGGVVWEEVAFKADGNSGPFRVLSPNEGDENYRVGDYQEVTWDVSNTDNNRVKCYYVNIKLSTDGGFTYPFTLLESTPNDGSAFVTIPDAITGQARIRVEAANNVFFDISDQDFIIEAATEPGYTVEVNPVAVPLYCLPADPLDIAINTSSLLDYDTTLNLSLVGDIPDGVDFSFGESTLVPGETTNLTLEFDGFEGRDTLDMSLQVVAGQDTVFREIRVIALFNDFSDLSMLTPADGETGIVFSTDFSWTDISEIADAYDIEIATNPSFSEEAIVETATGLTTSSYEPDFVFENNSIYYWRVRPINDCGEADFLTPFAFQTATVDCPAAEPEDLPINLPTSTSTLTSSVFVPASGTISGLTVSDVNINYNPVNSLVISLKGPSGTEVVLFDRNCLNTGLINISFDDLAPTNIQCPPISGNPVRPVGQLSAFIGESTQGSWELKVEIEEPGFGVGSVNSWKLEFCAAIVPNAPILIRNEQLLVPPGQSNTFTTDVLEVQDENSAPENLRYILLSVPEHGQLLRAGQVMAPGDFFTQATINAFNLTYLHDGSDTEEDEFVFVVTNPEQGWIPAQTFQIGIDENATVSAKRQDLENKLSISPNPATDELTLRFSTPLSGELGIRLLNAQGQIVQRFGRVPAMDAVPVSVANLPRGVYFVVVENEGVRATRKVVVQ